MSEITIDGRVLKAPEGSTILSVAEKAGIRIPTLCFLKNRSAVGSCRLCVVAVEGEEHPLPACKTPARDGMVVTTSSPTLISYRRIALELIISGVFPGAWQISEDEAEVSEQDLNELQRLCREYGVSSSPYASTPSPKPFYGSNPFLSFNPNLCIRCQRCVGACNNAAHNHSLQTGRKGTRLTIGAPFGKDWKASICESCANCAAACPTGAISTKSQLGLHASQLETVRTTCPFCGVGCQIDLKLKDGKLVDARGADGPANKGLLCVKGRSASYAFVDAADRLRTPLIKNRQTGAFDEATWDEALSLITSRFSEIKAAHGGDALAAFACSRSTNEEIYLFQKMARTVLETNNVDNCARV